MIRWLLLTACAGALGTLARFGLSVAVSHLAGTTAPVGTLVVNLIGCFLCGVVVALADQQLGIADDTRRILLVGFLGAFTTFSALMLETTQLATEGRLLVAIGNLVVQNGLGVGLLLFGIWIIRR